MKDRFVTALWGLGVRIVHLGKLTGLPGAFERALAKMATRVIPSPPTELTVPIPLGMKPFIPTGFSRARTYAAGRYERLVTIHVERLLKDGMVMVDVGAFCGYYTLLASRLVGASGKVYAFKPHPTSYAYLLKNIEINGCRNVKASNIAVANSSGSAVLCLHAEADHHWLSVHSSSNSSMTVRTVSIDDFFAQEK